MIFGLRGQIEKRNEKEKKQQKNDRKVLKLKSVSSVLCKTHNQRMI